MHAAYVYTYSGIFKGLRLADPSIDFMLFNGRGRTYQI